MSIFTYHYQIKYSDVGKDNTLALKALVAILQESAGLHSVKAGYSVNDIPQTHAASLVLDWKVKIFLHPRWNEILTIHTWPRTLDKLYSYRDFEVYDSTNKLVAIASSKWILFDTEKKKVRKITKEVFDAYDGITEKSVFNSPWEEKIKVPETLVLNFNYTIQRRDIDTNGHVNNLHYIDYALESLDDNTYENSQFNNLEIIYKKEIKYKETIHGYDSFEDNKHIITIKSEDDSNVHAIIKLY